MLLRMKSRKALSNKFIIFLKKRRNFFNILFCRKLCLKYHPDKNSSEDAQVRIQQIYEAYQVFQLHKFPFFPFRFFQTNKKDVRMIFMEI